MVISTHISFGSVIITCLLRYSGKCFLIIRCLFAAQLTGKLITCLINYCGSYISYAHHNVVNPINMENSSVRRGNGATGNFNPLPVSQRIFGFLKAGERGEVSCVPLRRVQQREPSFYHFVLSLWSDHTDAQLQL